MVAEQLRDELIRTALANHEDPYVRWLDGEPWDDNRTDMVLTVVHQVQRTLFAHSISPLPSFLESMRLRPEQVNIYRDILVRLGSEVEAIRSDTSESRRTGDLRLQVGVLNAGDFDGVVAKEGISSFEGGKFPIHSEKYTVVKAHGFEEIVFSTEKTIENTAIREWRNLVINHTESDFELRLTGSDNNSFDKKNHLVK